VLVTVLAARTLNEQADKAPVFLKLAQKKGEIANRNPESKQASE
jgi:hypothetical protein